MASGPKEVGNLLIKMRLETAELKASVASAQKSLKSLSSTAQNVGRSMSLALSLPLTALGTYAVKSFSDFDDAMTRSMAIMGKVSSTMKAELVAGAIKVSETTKSSSIEAAEGYYFLASAGLTAEQSLKALPVVATFATAANMKLAEASDRLVDVTKAVGLASTDAEKNMEGMARVSNVLAQASVDSNVTIQDLASSLAGPLGGALRITGTQIETAAAALEALGGQGVKAKAAGTALGIVVRELGIDAVKHAKAFKDLKVNVFDADGNRNNFIDVIKDIEKALDGLSPRMKQIKLMSLGFNKKNLGFIQLFIGMADSMKKFETSNKDTASAAKLAEANMQSFYAQMTVLQHKLQNVAITMGNDLAPTIRSLGEAVVWLAQAFQSLPDWLRKTIEIMLAIVAVAGPITFFFGNFATILWGLVKALPAVIVGLGGLINSMLGLAGFQLAGMGLIAWPALLVAAFVAAGIAIAVFWDDIVAGATFAVDAISSAWNGIADFLSPLFQVISDAATVAWDAISEIATTCATKISEQFSTTVSQLNGMWNEIVAASNSCWDACITGFNKFSAWVEKKAPGLQGTLSKLFNATIDVTAKALDIAGTEVAKTATQVVQSAVDAKNIIVGGAAKLHAEANQIKVYDATKGFLSQADEDAQKLVSVMQQLTGSNNEMVQSAILAGDAYQTLNNVQYQSSMTGFQAAEAWRIFHAQALKNLADEEAADKKATAAAEKRTKALEGLQDKLKNAINKDDVKDIQNAIKDGLTGPMTDEAFASMSKKLYDATYRSIVEANRAALIAAGNSPEAIATLDKLAKVGAQKNVDEQIRAREESKEKELKVNAEIAADRAEKDKKSYDESVSYFKDIFTAATDGAAYNFRDKLKEVFIDLGANLAATIEAALSGKSTGGSGGDMMSSIANGIAGLFGGGDAASNGMGPLADGDAYGKYLDSKAGPGLAEIFASVISTGFDAYYAKGIDKKNKDNSGTGGAVGGGVGAGIGMFFGPGGAKIGGEIGKAIGAMIGSQIKWGAQNPETIARHAFANFIESSFAKLGQVSFIDAKGKLQNMKGKDYNFLEKSLNFNDPKAFSNLNSLGVTAQNTFKGLGLALKEVLGLTDAVAEQLGALLAENLNGNIDNARLLFLQLGLSAEDLIEKLMAVGKSGQESWLTVISGIQGIEEAAKPGLQAIGAYAQAFQNLIDSGGRGMAAIKSVKDIAVEGIEAGVKTLDELKQKMLADGLSPEYVASFFDEIAKQGIKTLQQLQDATDRQFGTIVAGMNANNAELAKKWEDMGNQLNDIRQKIEAIPTKVATDYQFNVTTNMDDETRKILSGANIQVPQTTTPLVPHAKGGIITGPMGIGSNGIVGEAGPEGLLPLGRMGDGSLGVRMISGKGNRSGGVNITVNAPYANPGTADHIRRTILELEPYLTSKAIQGTVKAARRGGAMRGNFR